MVADPNDIYTQRQADREERKKIERQLLDAFWWLNRQAANNIMSMIGQYVPDACRSEAYDELIFQLFAAEARLVSSAAERMAEKLEQAK